MAEEICRLCFKKAIKAISIFSVRGLELNIAEILRKHFSDEVNEDDDVLPKFVCPDCWSKSNQFHDFYNAVAEAQQIFLANLVKIEEPEIIEINCVPYSDEHLNDPLLKTEPTRQGDKIDDVAHMNYGLDDLSTAIDTISGADNESVQVKCEVHVGQKSALKGDSSSENVNTVEATPVLPREICEGDATSVLQNYRQLLLLRPFECDICQKRYKSKNAIRKHKITCHGYNQGRFECDICHKRFNSRANVEMHVKVTHHNLRYVCQICAKEYKTSTSLQEHLLTHVADTKETPRIKCELCSSTFKNVKGLRKHLPIHNTHSAELQCLQCPEKLPNRHKLIRHIANRHKVHKCHLCEREFVRSDQLKRHLELRSAVGGDGVKCDEIVNVDLTETEAAELAKSIYEKTCKFAKEKLAPLIPKYFDMVCEKCNYEFKSFVDAYSHYTEEHKLSRATVKCCQRQLHLLSIRDHILYHLNPDVFKCNDCEKRFSLGHLLRGHAKKWHRTLPVELFECDLCHKKYKSKEKIRSHMLKSHGRDKGRFKCDTCQKRFNSRTLMKQHVKSKHQNVRHVCHICAKEFVSLGGLRNHIQNHDADTIEMPRIKCESCPSTFKSMAGLRKHMPSHQILPEALQCPYCPKKMPNKFLLNRHVSNRHNYKVYHCDLCEREFRYPLELERHKKSHITENMQKCDYCPKQFKEKRYVTVHMKMYHKNEWTVDHKKRK